MTMGELGGLLGSYVVRRAPRRGQRLNAARVSRR